jgi:hypothetical protein
VDRFSLARITTIIDSLTTLLDESKERNFLRWSILGHYVWPNYFVGKTYAEEIHYLKSWVDGRLRWLDQALNTVSVGSSPGEREIPQGCELAQNFPNPFNSTTKIRFTIVNPRLPHGAQNGGQGQLTIVKVFDLLGREKATLVNEVKEPGAYSIEFDASKLSSGVYFCQMSVLPQARQDLLPDSVGPEVQAGVPRKGDGRAGPDRIGAGTFVGTKKLMLIR